ncbi:MAG TPA: YkgJ family cysteine cluster protein [Dongiaceae bacterium]|nr:YkgJ family cysteine cluster protein [Dongiaceae bacterium]
MSDSMSGDGSRAEDLCLACGLCCNGVIFADVRLQPGDDAARLRALGLRVFASRAATGAPGFKQPCAALAGCSCRVYAERPGYCREFECLLLQRVKAGRLERRAALAIIGVARERVERVRRLLRELGDGDETLALSARFRRTAARLEKVGLDEVKADLFGELTLAVHDLNLAVKEAFYP